MRYKLTLISFITLLIISCDLKTAPEYLMEAEKLEQQGKFKEAIQLLDKAILKDENFLGAYINRGADKSELGEYVSAIEDYKKVIEIDPKNTLALYNIGNNYKRCKNYKKSLEFYNKAFDTKGGDTSYIDLAENSFVDLGQEFDVPGKEIYYERGISFFYLDSLNNSFKDFRNCIKQNYKSAESNYWLGHIYLRTNQKKLACEKFNEAKELGDKDAEGEIKKYCNQ